MRLGHSTAAVTTAAVSAQPAQTSGVQESTSANNCPHIHNVISMKDNPTPYIHTHTRIMALSRGEFGAVLGI